MCRKVPLIESAEEGKLSEQHRHRFLFSRRLMRHLGISGNKSSHLFTFPSRQGIILPTDLPSHLQCLHTELQPRGERSLCIHLTGCHGDVAHLCWLCAEVQTVQIRQGRYCYENQLLPERCHMCNYIEYIVVYLLFSCNETKKVVRHDIILSVLKATTWFLQWTIAYFDRMRSGTPANTVTVVFGYRWVNKLLLFVSIWSFGTKIQLVSVVIDMQQHL